MCERIDISKRYKNTQQNEGPNPKDSILIQNKTKSLFLWVKIPTSSPGSGNGESETKTTLLHREHEILVYLFFAETEPAAGFEVRGGAGGLIYPIG